MPPECNRCGLYHGSDKTCGEVRAAIVEQTQRLAERQAKEDRLSAASARVVEAAVERRLAEIECMSVSAYAPEMEAPANRLDVATLAESAAVDALIAAREGR